MSDQTFHVTSEDVRKIESKESKFHGGEVPKDSDTAALKVSLDTRHRVALSISLPLVVTGPNMSIATPLRTGEQAGDHRPR
jgi:hypothetical protein